MITLPQVLAGAGFWFLGTLMLAYVWWVYVSARDSLSRMSKKEKNELMRKMISGETEGEE